MKFNVTLSPELRQRMAEAAKAQITPVDYQQQRISFCYGTLPKDTTLTRADVAELDYAKHGNLAELYQYRDNHIAISSALLTALEYFEDKEDMSEVDEEGIAVGNKEAAIASSIRRALKC